MMMTVTIKTPYREKMDARDWAIYNERKALSINPDSNMTAIDKKLMNKYRLKSRSSIWSVIRRVEERGMEYYTN